MVCLRIFPQPNLGHVLVFCIPKRRVWLLGVAENASYGIKDGSRCRLWAPYGSLGDCRTDQSCNIGGLLPYKGVTQCLGNGSMWLC